MTADEVLAKLAAMTDEQRAALLKKMQKTHATIGGVEFERQSRGLYVRFQKADDVMLTDRGPHTRLWDIYLHRKDGSIIDSKMGLYSEDAAVYVAKEAGFFADAE